MLRDRLNVVEYNSFAKPVQNPRWEYGAIRPNYDRSKNSGTVFFIIIGRNFCLAVNKKIVLVQVTVEENSFRDCKMKEGEKTAPIFVLRSLNRS